MVSLSTLLLTSGLRRCVAAAAVLAGCAFASPAQAQTWMVSTTPYVKLGVLDKYNSLGGFSAVFIVKEERSGKEFLLTKVVPKGESGVDVLFPTEPSDPEYFKNTAGLAAQPGPGSYVWECRVNGKRAVGGHFVYPEVGNDVVVVGAQR